MNAVNKHAWSDLTEKVIGACLEVHKTMGPALLEKVYVDCLCREFDLREISYQREVEYPIYYKGSDLGTNIRIDLLVEDTLVLEIKAVGMVLPVFYAQLISYLKLADKPVGMLINFHEHRLMNGCKIMFRDYQPKAVEDRQSNNQVPTSQPQTPNDPQ
jgi:GxxExxY protein